MNFVRIDNTPLQNYTLVLPTPSLGNVGQFAIDLYLSTLLNQKQATKVGYFDDDRVLPFASPSPFEPQSGLAINLELYANHSAKIVFLQQRAPIIKNKNAAFAESLTTWIQEQSISKVIVLSSIDGAYRIDEQLGGSPLRFLANKEKWASLHEELVKSSWLPLEEIDAAEQLEAILRRGSYLNALSTSLNNHNIPFAVLVCFCSEGDNIPDAIASVTTCDKYLKLLPSTGEGRISLVMPYAWQNLFGSPVSMYPTIF